MTSREVLSGQTLTEATADLTGWTVEQGKLHKEYVFADFVEAFSFMTAAALCAERVNHHPEWFNVYRTVRIDLSTHDVGGITMFDVELAREFDLAAG
ncbi:MAG: 4a-hydroxytetrahydrobiopterin dehydratase [Longimicrobiales bacterium]|nr:4a-hydroxytetrahydrobiopterin dehydratase [Longimicrobiales bacterium]